MIPKIARGPIVLLALMIAAHADDEPSALGKAAALRAVTSLFLEPNVSKFVEFFHSKAEYGDDGEVSATDLVKELKEAEDEIAERLVVKEILFLVASDLPDIRRRFAVRPSMWRPQRVPAYLKKGFACLVVCRDRRDEEVELFVLVFAKTEEGYRITYFDNT